MEFYHPSYTLIKLKYYIPETFTLELDSNPWTYNFDNVTYVVEPITQWGNKDNYEEMFNKFENIKKAFLDKQIPVIINEVGDGIMTCLWDTSKKGAGNMNYYDKENDRWYDEKIRDFLAKISKGEYVKPTEYYFFSNQETVYNIDSYGNLVINIGEKKATRAEFNVLISGINSYSVGFGISSIDKNGNWISEAIFGDKGIKQDDDSYSFFIDIKDKDFNEHIQIAKWWGNSYTTFKYLTLIYDKEYIYFNYIEYKNAISNYI